MFILNSVSGKIVEYILLEAFSKRSRAFAGERSAHYTTSLLWGADVKGWQRRKVISKENNRLSLFSLPILPSKIFVTYKHYMTYVLVSQDNISVAQHTLVPYQSWETPESPWQ